MTRRRKKKKKIYCKFLRGDLVARWPRLDLDANSKFHGRRIRSVRRKISTTDIADYCDCMKLSCKYFSPWRVRWPKLLPFIHIFSDNFGRPIENTKRKSFPGWLDSASLPISTKERLFRNRLWVFYIFLATISRYYLKTKRNKKETKAERRKLIRRKNDEDE